MAGSKSYRKTMEGKASDAIELTTTGRPKCSLKLIKTSEIQWLTIKQTGNMKGMLTRPCDRSSSNRHESHILGRINPMITTLFLAAFHRDKHSNARPRASGTATALYGAQRGRCNRARYASAIDWEVDRPITRRPCACSRADQDLPVRWQCGRWSNGSVLCVA